MATTEFAKKYHEKMFPGYHSVYQAVAYLGIGRVFPFLRITNEVLTEGGISLPLPSQATTTTENRRETGTQAQVDIFGENMREFWKSGPEESRHINYWLADNCFGDYYTRTGLDYKQRERKIVWNKERLETVH